MDGRMLHALRAEATALAQMPTHKGHPAWSINADAGTVTELPEGGLVAYLHPASIDQEQLHGLWFFPHDRGTT